MRGLRVAANGAGPEWGAPLSEAAGLCRGVTAGDAIVAHLCNLQLELRNDRLRAHGHRSSFVTMAPTVFAALSKQITECAVGQPTERRTHNTGQVPSGLREYALDVAQRSEPFLAMICAHAAGPDAPERQIVHSVMKQSVVDRHIAAGRMSQD